MFNSKFISTIYKCKRIGEFGAQQLLLDVFTLKTIDGQVLAYEKEDIRIKRMSMNRLSNVYDANGNPTGSLKENKLKDFGKLKYIFHIYDEDGHEIGASEKFSNISFIQTFKIKDYSGQVEYDIDKKTIFNLFKDKYVISVQDNNPIVPLYKAIFVTCIEDAIGDAQASSSSSSSIEEATEDNYVPKEIPNEIDPHIH